MMTYIAVSLSLVFVNCLLRDCWLDHLRARQIPVRAERVQPTARRRRAQPVLR